MIKKVSNKMPESISPDEAAPKAENVMTSRSVIEAAANVQIPVPPVTDSGEEPIKAVHNDNEEAEFMRTATPEDLEKLRALTEQDILTDAIVAMDVSIPTFLDVQPKDPIYVLRWVNRKYNGESGGANRYQEMKAMGFVNAVPGDIAEPFSDQINYQDGAYICNDVILMKINKARLYGYYKANLLKANKIHSRANVHNEALKAGREEMRKQLAATGVKPSVYQGKLGMFVPDKIPGALD